MTTEGQYAPEPDPVFETRAELEMWALNIARDAKRDPAKQLATLDRIRRVTLAHLHLREGEG
jgi:hypothetical protein